MTIAEMHERLSYDEYREWFAYFKIQKERSGD